MAFSKEPLSVIVLLIFRLHDNQLLSIGVRFDFAQETELQRADIVIDDLKDLLQVQLA